MKTEYKSEDEKVGFSQSDLNIDGTIVHLYSIIEKEGRFVNKQTGKIQPYYTIEGTTIDEFGDEVEFTMNASNQRLMSMLIRELTPKAIIIRFINRAPINGTGKGIWVKMYGDGKEFARHYWMTVADSYSELA